MKPKFKLPTIIGITLLVIGLGAGILLIQNRQNFRLGASPDTAPNEVRITNITDESFTVSWVTDKSTVGFVIWGSNQSPTTNANESNINPSQTHSITIENLASDTNYYFKINSDGTEVDNSGIPWDTKTISSVQKPDPKVISGSVLTATGEPIERALVYISPTGFKPLSTVTSKSGSWVLNLNSTSPVPDSVLLEIFVQAGTSGISSAQIYASSADPVPTMVLGEVHNFKNTPPSNTSGEPTATLSLPTSTQNDSSGFDLTQSTPSASLGGVTLESLIEGEVITSIEPEFFGEGPIGSVIEISVQSTPQSDSVTIDSTGSWKWSPPEGLEEGEHTVTLKWTDAQGILRTLTRNFVVHASDGPAFESTPSASPSTTSSASPSATPRVSYPSTDSGVPVAGIPTPTIALLLMATGFITLGMYIARESVSIKS